MKHKLYVLTIGVVGVAVYVLAWMESERARSVARITGSQPYCRHCGRMTGRCSGQ